MDVGERKAIAVFTSEENARGYAQACGLLEPWQVGEMPEEEFFRWLRHSLVKGVPLLAVNPTTGLSPVREIFSLLAELEA